MSTKVICEIPFPPASPELIVDVPTGAQFLTLKVDRGTPTIFLLADVRPVSTEPRKFVALPAGAYLKPEIEHCTYLDTITQKHGGPIHFYEVPIAESRGAIRQRHDWHPIQVIETDFGGN